MLETLRDMMARDSDAQVVANCMTVLQQAGQAQSFSSRGVVIPLVNRIKARPRGLRYQRRSSCCSPGRAQRTHNQASVCVHSHSGKVLDERALATHSLTAHTPAWLRHTAECMCVGGTAGASASGLEAHCMLLSCTYDMLGSHGYMFIVPTMHARRGSASSRSAGCCL